MIPKIIHYCWFGKNPIPKNLNKYIDGWRKKLPEYTIIEWNENNFDVKTAPKYVQEAYVAKKYAFVSDYVRIYALYNYGGIYFDTDIEVLKPFDDYLEGNNVVLGFEFDGLLTTAFLACEKKSPFFGEFLNSYIDRLFIKDDGTFDTSTINDHLSLQAKKWGVNTNLNEMQEFGAGMFVYPIEVFSGFDVKNWHPKITEKTRTVHHMAASWVNSKKRIYFAIIFLLQKLLGYKLYDKLKAFLKNGK